MKVKVTEQGVYDAKGERVPVGTVINVKGDALPGYLIGKAQPLDIAPRVAVTNPKETEEEQPGGEA